VVGYLSGQHGYASPIPSYLAHIWKMVFYAKEQILYLSSWFGQDGWSLGQNGPHFYSLFMDTTKSLLVIQPY